MDLRQIKIAGMLGAVFSLGAGYAGMSEYRAAEQRRFADDIRIVIDRFSQSFQGSRPYAAGWTGTLTTQVREVVPNPWQGNISCTSGLQTPWGGCWSASFNGTAYVLLLTDLSRPLCRAALQRLPGHPRVRWFNAGPGVSSYTAGIDLGAVAASQREAAASDGETRCTGTLNNLVLAFQ